jgi:hypothetical protein
MSSDNVPDQCLKIRAAVDLIAKLEDEIEEMKRSIKVLLSTVPASERAIVARYTYWELPEVPQLWIQEHLLKSRKPRDFWPLVQDGHEACCTRCSKLLHRRFQDRDGSIREKDSGSTARDLCHELHPKLCEDCLELWREAKIWADKYRSSFSDFRYIPLVQCLGLEPEDPDFRTLLADRLKALKEMPYRDYLSTPEWKLKRELYYEHPGTDRCALCNRTGFLDLHHRTYERIGEEAFEDLIALCRICHERHHAKEKA